MKYLNIFDKLSKNVKNIDFLSNISKCCDSSQVKCLI